MSRKRAKQAMMVMSTMFLLKRMLEASSQKVQGLIYISTLLELTNTCQFILYILYLESLHISSHLSLIIYQTIHHFFICSINYLPYHLTLFIICQYNQFIISHPMKTINDHQQQNCAWNGDSGEKRGRGQCMNKKGEESQILQRISHYRISIRNREINEYKNAIRQELLSIKLLEEMVQNMPTDSKSTYSWAYELSHIYSQAAKYVLTPDKVVQLFRLVQKFPNQLTLQLLEIIIYKSNSDTIDLMFQYDVMKLLHSFINFSNMIPLKRFNKTQTNDSGDDYIRQAIVIKQAVQKVAECANLCQQDDNYEQKVQLTRMTLRVISELCRKKSHIRNFAIVNHKSYTYVLKSYKHFQKDIEIQFTAFLEAVTSHPFTRNEEQFDRIINKILAIFFNQKIQLKIQILQQKNNRNYYISYEYLILAMTNLIKMKCSWILQKMFAFVNEENKPKIIIIVLNLIQQCNYVFGYPTIEELKEDLLPNHLFKLIVELAMNAVEVLDKMGIEMVEKEYIHLALLQFLKKGKIIMHSSSLTIARRGIYFMLSNYLYENIPTNIAYQILFFQHNNSPHNLLSLITFFLQAETDQFNKQELYQLIRSIFQNLSIKMIEPLLLSSELLAIITEQLLEESYSMREESLSQSTNKKWIMKLIHLLFVRLSVEDKGKFMQYKQMMLGMYENRLQVMMGSERRDESLCEQMDNFLYLLKGGCMQ